MDPKFAEGTILNEGCTLHYSYIGNGPLFTFIPGGTGHGKQYHKIMSLLSDKYTCMTYDRRQMSASTVEGPNKKFDMDQQVRDIVAIIKALNFTETILFGSSLGGLIALQFASSNPHQTTHLIAHEAPTNSLLPDSSSLHAFYLSAHTAYVTSGLQAAFKVMLTRIIGFDPNLSSKTHFPDPKNPVNFWENEFLEVLEWETSRGRETVERIKGEGVSTGVMCGEKSGEAYFARCTVVQAEILGCERVVAPGNHSGYESEAEVFEPVLRALVRMLEEKKLEKLEK